MKIMAGIPTYNKQYPVCGVIHAAEDYVDEIIVVDDGSTDNTSKLAKRAGAIVLRHETNKGKAAAVRTLIKTFKKSFIKNALQQLFLIFIKTLTKNGFIRFRRTA